MGRVKPSLQGAMMQLIIRALAPLTPPAMRSKVCVYMFSDFCDFSYRNDPCQLRVVSPQEESAGILTQMIEPSQLETRFGGGTKAIDFDTDLYLSEHAPLDPLLLVPVNSEYVASTPMPSTPEKVGPVVGPTTTAQVVDEGAPSVAASSPPPATPLAAGVTSGSRGRPLSAFGIRI